MAGNAVLVQQYFNEGFYPSGAKNPQDAFVPSGALIKAMLVHSGKALDTVTYDDDTQASTGGYPSNMQGYGKIRLSDVLNFGESTNDPISLFVKGDVNESSPMYASIDSTLEVDRFYIIAPSPSSPIRVTMTYTDQMGTVGSSHPLVNDLELRVMLNGGDEIVPYYNSDSSINNIEMIDILEPCAGCNYTIQVRAVSLSAKQPYALVASGILTPAVSNVTSVESTSSESDESIGPNTMRIIIVLGVLCLLLGAIVVYLHRCDKPIRQKKHQKTFQEEQAEQAEALRYYEEQHRQRTVPPRGEGEQGSSRRRERRGERREGEREEEGEREGRKKKKKKGRSREREREGEGMEMARQQGNSAHI